MITEQWENIYENKSGSIMCWSKKIHVLWAQYGSTDDACKADVTAIIRTTFEGKNGAGTMASNEFFGDPCPGNYKKLAIQYECY